MTNTQKDTLRKIARIEKIIAITPIDNADNIEKVTIKGWNVVNKKGIHNVGDLVIFCEIDACLPLDDPRFSFLESYGGFKDMEGKKYHKLSTKKLRGIYSQGLILPLNEFPELLSIEQDVDVSDQLGIILQPEITSEYKGPNIIGNFPTYLVRKTDAERIQNLHNFIHSDSFVDCWQWLATEKIDGESRTIWKENDTLRFASRNYEIKDSKIAEKDIAIFRENMKNGEIIQGELARGKFFVFNFYSEEYSNNLSNLVSYDDYPRWLKPLRVPKLIGVYQNHVIDDFLNIENLVDSMESVVFPGEQLEGIVWSHKYGETYPELGNRHCFKVINPSYLIKQAKKENKK